MSSYPGGKNGAGVWQRIISHIPRHRVLVELFGGGAAVTRHILPADLNLIIESDAAVIADQRERIRQACPTALIIHEHAFEFLDRGWVQPDWCVYADPPYYPDTLLSRPRYNHLLSTDEHSELLFRLADLPCPVLISGYRCELYDQRLAGWYRTDYIAGTRGGPAAESLWSNRGQPDWPHDGRYVGDDFRERETRCRRRRTWRRRLAACDRPELLTIAEDLASTIAECGSEVLLADVLTRIQNRRLWREEQLRADTAK